MLVILMVVGCTVGGSLMVGGAVVFICSDLKKCCHTVTLVLVMGVLLWGVLLSSIIWNVVVASVVG